MTEVRKVVVDAIADAASLDADEIRDEFDLGSDLGFDDAEIYDLAIEIEELLELELEDEEIEGWATVGDVVRSAIAGLGG